MDGNGLTLEVRPTGAASWVLRVTVDGRRREMGLGPARGPEAVSLAEAREKAAEARRTARVGADPVEARRAAAPPPKPAPAPAAITFRAAAEGYIAAHSPSWRNPVHRAQWASTLAAHAYPTIGAMALPLIDTPHIEAILRPIWNTKPTTASRLRGRIEAVLDYAAVQGWRLAAPNPARWRGHMAMILPRPSKLRRVAHHPALPWTEAPAFVTALRQREGIAALALQFLILTAARTGEVIGMRWGEVDLAQGIWIVPGERMKAGREHRVPLSEPAVAVLRAVAALRPDAGAQEIVFARRGGGALSNMAMAAVIKRMNEDSPGTPRWRDEQAGEAITVHGFRSTFRDWGGEATAHPREVIEHALAHRLADRVEAAYQRSTLLAKRRALMADWAAFLGREPAKVLPFIAEAAGG
jgi:integrase